MDIPRAASTLLNLPGSAVDTVRGLPHQAQQLTGDLRRLVAEAFDLLDRVRVLVDRAEAVVGEAERAVGRAGVVVDRAEAVVGRGESVVGGAEAALDRVQVLLGRAEQLVDHGDAVAAGAQRAVDHVDETARHAEEQVQRIRALLDEAEPSLHRMMPLVERGAATFRPAHLTALAQFLDRLPDVVDLIDPALRSMANMPPMSDVAERLDNVGQIVEGLPGSGMLRRRGQTKEDESTEED